MKVCGRMMKEKEREYSFIQMETNLKVRKFIIHDFRKF